MVKCEDCVYLGKHGDVFVCNKSGKYVKIVETKGLTELENKLKSLKELEKQCPDLRKSCPSCVD